MRRVPLHRSLWKPILYMGCERTPFLIVAVSSALLVMEGGFGVKIFGVIYFIVMVGIMALVNANDPFFFQIIWRYLRYQDYYSSHAMFPGKSDKPKNF